MADFSSYDNGSSDALPIGPGTVIKGLDQLTADERRQFDDLVHAMLSAIGNSNQPITDELSEKFLKAVFRDWDTSHGPSLLPAAPDARTARKGMLEVGKFARDLPAQVTPRKRKADSVSDTTSPARVNKTQKAVQLAFF